jgi:S-DNA-T family DNA segregation ATPase FtsK/SpoIIIE
MATAVRKNTEKKKAHSRTNDVIAVILAALAVLAFLCLVSYNGSDPTFNTSSTQKTQNWVGVVGANLAEALVSSFGVVSYLLPALIALMAWRVFRANDLRISLGHILGYIVFVAALSSLASMFGFHGGVVGVFFKQLFFGLLGQIGTIVLLAAFALAALILITNLSLGSFLGSFRFAFENLGIHFGEWRERRRDRESSPIETAVANRRETVRTASETPSISTGDAVPFPTKSVRIRESAAAIFDEQKPVAEPVPAAAPAEDEPDDELPRPTISVSDDPVPMLDDEPPIEDLVAEAGKIPITPVRETGDLDSGLIADSDDFESVPVAKRPRNYEDWVLPLPEFLNPSSPRIEQKDEELLAIAQELQEKTKEFNVNGRVMHICQGPVVTTYEFKPDPGVKYSRVTGLSDDLCLALKAESIRIDRIPGKAYVGIEVPNRERETIHLREVIESRKFKDSGGLLTIALGKTIDGLNYVTDLAKMPHLLIAGATGAGKSVGVNTLVVSILYKAKPDEVKFIMVDPKRLELGVYADIPHLATPIITDPKRAAISLRWAVSEMERRYKVLAGWGVRNIDGYNVEVKRRTAAGELNDDGNPYPTLPYIVIIIDELADLMMVSGKEVEESITRLAQMARAVGIHLVLATQRPSVDVITGLIKANFPARISFRVSSKVDSRTIIDANGAERLLGRGDMLFLPPATSQLIRVHGAFVEEKEIHRIVEHIKAQGNPEYDTSITKTEEEMDDSGELPGRKDPLFWDAVRSVVGAKRASTSLLQRHLRIGYGRAAAILDAMVREGYIGEMDGGTRARPILQKAYDDLADIEEMEA